MSCAMVDQSIKHAAKMAVRRALRSGLLVRADCCELCSATEGAADGRALHGHHHLGYAIEHWLDVQWLCMSCHMKVHFDPAQRSAAGRKGGHGRAQLPAEELSRIGSLGAHLGAEARWGTRQEVA